MSSRAERIIDLARGDNSGTPRLMVFEENGGSFSVLGARETLPAREREPRLWRRAASLLAPANFHNFVVIGRRMKEGNGVEFPRHEING